MKKGLLIQLATAVLLVLITAANGYFYFRVFSAPKPDTPPAFVLMDSIRIIQQKRAQFQDSLIILDQQHETLTIKKDSIMRLDSMQWAGLRDSMRTSVRSRVAAKLRERAAR